MASLIRFTASTGIRTGRTRVGRRFPPTMTRMRRSCWTWATTAIRLTHYPQSDYWHNLCDHNGILLWNEVSLVNEIHATPEFSANAEQQLRELILQRYNHPSVAFWGLFNELALVKTTPPPEPLLQRLKSVVKELDQSRLIVCAIAIGHKLTTRLPIIPVSIAIPAGINKFGMLES